MAKIMKGEFIVEGLATDIEKIGKNNIVQVCMDNASKYVMASNILIDYLYIFWTPLCSTCFGSSTRGYWKVNFILI